MDIRAAIGRFLSSFCFCYSRYGIDTGKTGASHHYPAVFAKNFPEGKKKIG
jgi:hypothetical protein